VHVSPVLSAQTTYPLVRVEEAKQRKAAEGVRIFDFGIGDPREPVDPAIKRALVAALDEATGYPAAPGLPELRDAIAAWCGRRFGVELDPSRELIPTYGSKEAIFSFAQVAVDAASGKDLVLVPEPGYPVYERGARFARARVEYMPLRAEHGFVPDLDAVDDETWSRAALVWVCYPNNPTGAVAPFSFYERLAELAREHDFLVCSDEAYSELWFDEPPASALQVADRANVVVFNTLSKRSSMTGYRCGFVAAGEPVIESLRKFRPNVGTAPQVFVQRAAVAAWSDEEHVERNRALYARKRALFIDLFDRKGIGLAGSAATMYLWAETPPGESSEEFAERLLSHGVVVAPGSYFGPAGEGYVRLALVPTEQECADAVALLEDVL
jgi:N-succinyldiaminopimelate aminotransferase